MHIEISLVLQNIEAGYFPLTCEIIEFTVELQNNVGRLALKCDRYPHLGAPGPPKPRGAPIIFKGVPHMGGPQLFWGAPEFLAPGGPQRKKPMGRRGRKG